MNFASLSEIKAGVGGKLQQFAAPKKIQTQGCQQVADEADREYKKMSERITEGREAMKGSYSTFMAELQASGARLCKQTIPELSQSVEKAIDSLKNRYRIH